MTDRIGLNRTLLSVALAGLCAAPLSVGAMDTSLPQWVPGNWLVRMGASISDPQGETKVDDGDELVIDKDGPQFTGDVTWLFSPHLGLEVFYSAPFNHGIFLNKVATGNGVGEVEIVPLTMSLQYHFLPDGMFRPYVGVGATYAFVTGDEPPEIGIDDDFGFGGGVGVDIGPRDRGWFVNLAAKYIDLSLDADVDEGDKLTVEVDPLIYTLQLGYRFGHAAPVVAAAAPVAVAAPVAAAPPPPPPPPPPPKDGDRDGVTDDLDRCPNTTPGIKVDSIGCFLEATLNLAFEFDSSALTAADKVALDGALSNLRSFPPDIRDGIKVNVIGHTDSKGADAYNQRLSERRAAAVRDYLAAGGFPGAQMNALGMGETQPVADNATDEGRAQNRRVVLTATR